MLMFMQTVLFGGCIPLLFMHPFAGRKSQISLETLVWYWTYWRDETNMSTPDELSPPKWIKQCYYYSNGTCPFKSIISHINAIPTSPFAPGHVPGHPHAIAMHRAFFRMPRSLLPLSLRAGPSVCGAEAPGKPGGREVRQGRGWNQWYPLHGAGKFTPKK